MPLIATASSSVVLRHLSSHVWKHTLEQTDAKGFLFLWTRSASAYLFSPVSATNAGTSTFAGHPLWQGALTRLGQTPAGHLFS